MTINDSIIKQIYPNGTNDESNKLYLLLVLQIQGVKEIALSEFSYHILNFFKKPRKIIQVIELVHKRYGIDQNETPTFADGILSQIKEVIKVGLLQVNH